MGNINNNNNNNNLPANNVDSMRMNFNNETGNNNII